MDFASLALQVAPVSYYIMLYLGMSTCNVFFHHMCPKLFCLFLSNLIDFFIPCVIRLILSCPPVMCSFIRYALYCILQLHSDCFLIPMCLTLYDIMSTRDVFFYPRCPVFYFFLSIRNAFSHPMYHMLYIIRTTCDVFLCPMCLMVCFVLSIGIAFSSDLLYVLYCHIHSGSILLNHVSYVLFCLWPFGYLSPSDVS